LAREVIFSIVPDETSKSILKTIISECIMKLNVPLINKILKYFETLSQNKTKLLIVLSGVFVFGFFGTYLILTLIDKPTKAPALVNEFALATPAPLNEANPEEGVYNILFIGHGGKGHPGGLLADSIIISRVDTNTQKITLITIPRDLWVPGNHKINAAGVANGFGSVGQELTNVTGLPINYYIAVDFGNFVKLIDSLGGITVQVPKTFTDAFYPVTGLENDTCGKTEDEVNALKVKYSGFELEKQFACRYENLHFDAGETKLDGSTALKFARSRHGDSDFGRSLRQLAILEGVSRKLLSFRSLGKVDDVINSLLGLVKTDLNSGAIKTFMEIVGNPEAYSITQIQLTTENVFTESKSAQGAYILIPKAGNFNFSEVKSFIKSKIN
jgi:LCP family protein required for cell wall assembly